MTEMKCAECWHTLEEEKKLEKKCGCGLIEEENEN